MLQKTTRNENILHAFGCEYLERERQERDTHTFEKGKITKETNNEIRKLT